MKGYNADKIVIGACLLTAAAALAAVFAWSSIRSYDSRHDPYEIYKREKACSSNPVCRILKERENMKDLYINPAL